jgi:hypothetical protein
VDSLGDSSRLARNAPPQEVRNAARPIFEDNLQNLLAHAPFRFLTPLLRNGLSGIDKDADRNLGDPLSG